MPQELFTSVRFSKHIRQAYGHNLGKALGDFVGTVDALALALSKFVMKVFFELRKEENLTCTA